jgi:hypothetical protein
MFALMRSTKLGCFKSHSLSLWEALEEEGTWAWFHDVWTWGAKVLEYWMISSLKITLNCSWKFRGNWNVPLVLLERFWWARFNGIYLVRFGFRMWDILICKRFLPMKIQINSKKPGFGRKNQLRTWWHLNVYHSIGVEGIVTCLLVLLERSWQFKLNGIYVVRSALRMWDNVDRSSSCYFVMGSHLQV